MPVSAYELTQNHEIDISNTLNLKKKKTQKTDKFRSIGFLCRRRKSS